MPNTASAAIERAKCKTWLCSIIIKEITSCAEKSAPSWTHCRQECIEPLGLTVTEAAKRLGVTRADLEQFGKRQGQHLGRDGSAAFQSLRSRPEVWLGMQME
jgi:hypothetical protein